MFRSHFRSGVAAVTSLFLALPSYAQAPAPLTPQASRTAMPPPTPDTRTAPVKPILPAVLTDDAAYLPGTPEMIAAAAPTQILPHPQGRYALIVRQEVKPPPGPEMGEPFTGGTSIVLWDGLARRARVVWEQPSVQGTQRSGVFNLEWLPGSDVAVASVYTEAVAAPEQKAPPAVHSLLLIDPLHEGRARILRSGPTSLSLDISPSQPLVAVHEQETNPVAEAKIAAGAEPQIHTTVSFLSAKGQFSSPISLPPSSFIAGWNETGNGVYAIWRERVSPPEGTPPPNDKPRIVLHWASVDPRTGQVTTLPGRPKDWNKKPTPPATPLPPLHLVTRPVAVPGPDGKTTVGALHPLFLEGNAPAAATIASASGGNSLLLAPNADQQYLLADLNAVIYVSQSGTYVVPLYKLSRNDYQAAVRKAYRTRTMSQAKQIGLAMLMYSQDYDERLPPSADLSNVIGPYMKSKDILNNPATGSMGFTYLLNGNGLAGIDQPASSVLGYLTGMGGKAVIYVDGHVHWEDEPPKP